MRLSPGMLVQSRGKRFWVLESHQGGTQEGSPIQVLRLQALDDPHFVLYAVTPPEPVEPVETRTPSLERPGRLAGFRLLHQALLIESFGSGDALVAPVLSHIRREEYQQVPVRMALSLPRPRILIADDVGLGKTIEAGLILMELHARRRANRVLIVCPASLTHQWQREMAVKFGFRFVIFDRQTIAQKRRELEAGLNPWAHEPRVITSMDFIKRPDGAFRELQSLRWDLIIVDEAHHLASSGPGERDKLLTRLGDFLAEASDGLILLTATPHNGYDESMASLLRWLDPTTAPPDAPLDPHRYRHCFVRRLKRNVRNPDGTPKFIQRQPVQALEVRFSETERRLHERVRDYAQKIWQAAEEETEFIRYALRFVATIVSKRAASSRAALRATLTNRLELLQRRIEEIETDRDALRRWRRGEPLSPEELRKLENDAYASYLSIMRRLRKIQRKLEEETEEIEEILQILEACEREPDPKMQALFAWLQNLHWENPNTKVIVFSEYVDTVRAIEEFLRQNGYAERVIAITGEDPDADQKRAIHEFLFGPRCILIATDIAGEGLNLHYTCHHLVHFELPWNPNRMEQRNGRIDRYGQKHPPVIAFLYSRDSYEDEVLARLLKKLDAQYRATGTISDILGSFQQARLEEILMEEHRPDVADQVLDELLQFRVPSDRLPEDVDVKAAFRNSPFGSIQPPPLGDFVRHAVLFAGGRFEPLQPLQDGEAAYVKTPESWFSLEPNLKEQYERLWLTPPDDPNIPVDEILYFGHPLVWAAIQWLHSLRFKGDPEEVRLAYQVAPDLGEPEMIVTCLVYLRDEAGSSITVLEPVCLTRDRTSENAQEDRREFEQALHQPGGNVSSEILMRIFSDWWQDARRRAREEAKRRAQICMEHLQQQRDQQARRFLQELRTWRMTEQKAILGDALYEQWNRALNRQEIERQFTPTQHRRLRQVQERYEQLEQYWKAWAHLIPIREQDIEEVGILLRIPSNIL